VAISLTPVWHKLISSNAVLVVDLMEGTMTTSHEINSMKAKPQADSTDTIAMIVEIVFGIFGAMGMGWLYAGNIPVGIAAFAGFLILLALELLGISITLGFAACLTIPLNIVIAVVSGIKARDYVRNSGAQGNVLYVVIGAIGGLIIACVALAAITLFLGGIGALFEGMAAVN
jgi:hypothetical protein